MADPWRDLLQTLRATRFADLDGADVSLTLPVSTRLLTELVRDRLPDAVRRDEFALVSEPGDVIRADVRLTRPSFLPSFKVRLRIDRQPELPSAPVLGLRLMSQGLAVLAGPISRMLQALPAGIQLEGDLIMVDLARLMERYGAADLLPHLREMRVTTAEGRVVVQVRAGVGAATDGPAPG